MAKRSGGSKSQGNVRDARTGRYVPAREAQRRPDTTVTERRTSPKKMLPGGTGNPKEARMKHE